MKILHLIFSFNTGGSETMLIDIINDQIKYEEILLIIVNRVYKKELLERIDRKVPVYLINRKPGSRNLIPLIKLNYLIFKIKPDVIHCHSFELAQILFRKLFHSKIFLTVHGIGVPTKYHHKYDKIFAISKAVQKDIRSNCALDAKVVYNGIYFDSIKPKENYNFDIFKIVCVSRLYHQKKGQDVLIKAIQTMVKNNITNVYVDFIGEGKSLRYLEEMANEFNLQNHIRFLGLKDRNYIYSHLKDYNLLVQPSFYEGLGLTVVEAMAAKVPVLVSNIDGPMEIIDSGKYGYYFEVGNEKDCAQKILNIMEDYNNKIIQDRCEEVYFYAKDNFDIKKTASNYVSEYRKL